MTERCATCRYWMATMVGADVATKAACRRYPPAGERLHGATGGWPRTLESEWCGEWRARASPRRVGKDDQVVVETDGRLYVVSVVEVVDRDGAPGYRVRGQGVDERWVAATEIYETRRD